MTFEVGVFRARFAFVCDTCDLGYKRGRLARMKAGPGRLLECMRCAYGADPDVDDGAPAMAPALSDPRTAAVEEPAEPEPPALF